MTLRRLLTRGLIPLSVFALLATVIVAQAVDRAPDEQESQGTPAVVQDHAVPVMPQQERVPAPPHEPEDDHEDEDEGEHSHAREVADTVVAQLPATELEKFSLLGVTWRGGLVDDETVVEVRWRGKDGWSDWTELHVDPADEGIPGTEPHWVGEADAAAVRVLSTSDAAPRNLQLATVSPGKMPTVTPAATVRTAGAVPQPTIISRSVWGADNSGKCDSPVYGSTLRGAVIHHTAGSNTEPQSRSAAVVKSTQAYHMNSRAWCDIGYNFLVDRFGQIFEGRKGGIDKVVRGAHAGVASVNQETTGISLMGTFTSTEPSAAMKDAVVRITAWKLGLHGVAAKGTYSLSGKTYNRIAGHRDAVSTACPGTRVYAWLSASGGLRDRVETAIAEGGALAVPTGFEVTGTTTSTVTVGWQPVDDASGYRVYYGTQENGSGATKLEVTGTTATITGLQPGTRYHVDVAALDSSGGRSAYTSRLPAITAVATPSGFSATATTPTSITVSWQATPGATGYRLWHGTNPDGTGVTMHEVTGTSMTINGLTAGTTYYVDIAALAVGGTRSEYTPRLPVATPTQGDAFGTPTGFAVTAESSTSIKAAWNAVNGAAKYRVWYGTNANGTGATKVEVTGTSATITGLKANTTYYVDVAAINSSGTLSAYTARQSVKTTAAGAAFGTPTGFSVTSVSSTSVRASWNAVNGAAKYRVWYGTNANGAGATKVEVTGTSATITGLKANTTYYVDVAALNSAGTPSVYTARQPVQTTSAASPFGTPTGFTVTAESPTSVKASWNAVADAPKYRVWYGTNASGSGATKVEVTGTSATITGLKANTTYYVDVAALSSSGTPSAYTPRQSIKTPAAGALGTPTNFTLSAPTPTSVVASWNAVPGAPRYRLWHGTSPSGASPTMVETTQTSVTISGLRAGTTYHLDVAALNAAGTPSVYTPRQSIKTPVTGSFGTPTGLTTTGQTNTSISVAWNGVADAVGYRVWHGTSSTGAGAVLSEVTEPHATIAGLASGTQYYVDVAAVRADGTWSSYTSRLPVKTTGTSSAKNTITVPSSRTIAFKGRGYGHGIGMSQYGAEGGARQGQKYDAILAKYYPGTTLSNKTGNIRVLISKDTTSDVVVEARSGITFRKLSDNSTISLPTTVGSDAVNRWSIGVYKSDNKQSDLWYRTGTTWKPYQSIRWTGDAQFESSTPLKLQLPSGDLVSYRGALRSARPSNGSTVRDTVNVLGLEDYTRGVVAREMPSSWHPEALKAQSVAARTYGVRLLTPSRYYDACDTTSCQVYGGASAETAATDAAISATAGKILTYQGATALTQFSSSSGGFTNKGSQPYLKAVSDPWDGWSGNANHSWTINVKASTIEGKHPSIGTLRSIEVTQRNGNGDMGGRVTSVKLVGSKASKTISGVTARWDFGLRSDWFGF